MSEEKEKAKAAKSEDKGEKKAEPKTLAEQSKREREAKERAKKEAARLKALKERNQSKGKEGDYVFKADTKLGTKKYLCGDVCDLKGAALEQAKSHGLVVKHEDFKGKGGARHVGK
jgi:uncharacterized protein YaiL (DUF2058 family)